MKISYNWLKEYIEIPESPEEIGKVLTSTGLEVESVEPFESVKGGLQGLVVGEVLTCQKHPNADKLSLTTVDVGSGKTARIVCGAPNVAAGQKVVVALPGTTIYPVTGEPITIKTTKIRGEQSEGMICAEDEIGLGKSHAGIIVLNGTGLTNGTLAAAYFRIQSDFVIEIGLTPNRADAASHIGVARDIKASRGRAIRWPSVESFAGVRKSPITIRVENNDACIRYSGVTIEGVQVGESPAWLKQRLQCIGLKPVNNVVDITNFVLHETGQPLHAFDADAITGNTVIVKTLPNGTRFKTLDGKDRTLTAHDLMICNEKEGMCIAGVLGGLDSGITDRTKRIFLESACFSPAYIRRTGMYHQIKTDASFRFERGTDPAITVYALKRAALLIREIAGGQLSEVEDVYPTVVANREIVVKDKNVTRLIGLEIPRERMFSILESLDITIREKKDSEFTVSVPPYRVDVLKEADVIEEILRIYGFNNIPLSTAAGTGYLSDFPATDINQLRRTLGEALTANGFYEILTNSLTRTAYLQRNPIDVPGEAIEILNKLSEEQAVLRQTLLFTGLEVCAHNINRKQKDLKLYEHGKVYWKSDGKYFEQERLALYLTGNLESDNWQNKPRSVNFYDLKQYVSIILEKCFAASGNVTLERSVDSRFDTGVRIMQGKVEIGAIGRVKTAIAKEFGIKQEIFFADLDMSLLFKSANPKFEVQEVPKFPEVRRDLSLVLDRHVTFDDIRQLVLKTEKKLVRDIVAFDVYEGDKIPKGKKAYALGFTLLDEKKTLTDEEIDDTMTRLMQAFENQMGALIRK